MPLRTLDAGGQRLYDSFLREWEKTTFREIFGLGMVIIGLIAAYKPAGSISLAYDNFGIHPLLHAVWYVLAGWGLAKYGNRGRWFRWFFTLPMLFYIGLTAVWMYENWERSNLIVQVQYLMLYIAMMKLIVDDRS